ncbi:MAG: 8-oxo-dGTP diphosphatase [Clostridia bacterium]|nr:8-oxo-dGTP diphosphatase [Clostridia bacterium]
MINSTLCYLERKEADGEPEVLLLHRVKKKNDLNHDKWIGIGGKFEEGESPEDCLLREAREETGLKLTSWQYRGIVTFITTDLAETEYMHLFTADGFEGTLSDCDEGTLEWVPKRIMRTFPTWEGDRFFLDLLDQGAPFFSLKLRYEGDRLREAVLNGRRIV